MMKLPVGGTATHYYNTNMMDKIAFAGALQQDAMMDMLKANGLIQNDTNEQ